MKAVPFGSKRAATVLKKSFETCFYYLVLVLIPRHLRVSDGNGSQPPSATLWWITFTRTASGDSERCITTQCRLKAEIDVIQ